MEIEGTQQIIDYMWSIPVWKSIYITIGVCIQTALKMYLLWIGIGIGFMIGKKAK